MSCEFTRKAVKKFLPAQFSWIWCKSLLKNLIHSKIFNLTKYREVFVKYSLLITHAEMPLWIWHQLGERRNGFTFQIINSLIESWGVRLTCLDCNMYFICRFSDALSYMMSCKMKNRSSFGYYNSIYSSANGQKLANISTYRYKFILFLVKTGKIDQALNVITMPPSAILPNDVLNTTSKGKRFSGRLQEMYVGFWETAHLPLP